VLVDSDIIDALSNVVRVPQDRLGQLDDVAVDDLLNSRCASLPYSIRQVRQVLSLYNGHPYAIGAALGLLEAGEKLEQLPKKPEPVRFAKRQWNQICKKDTHAMRLFKAYAVLEVPVPDDVVEAVSQLDTDERQHLLADKYLAALLSEEGRQKRIYHAILSDYILGQMSEAENRQYHQRAAKLYRDKLVKAAKEQGRPDALAALRLPEHILAAEGKEAFVVAFVDDCCDALSNLGLLDAVVSLSERALVLCPG